MPPDVDSMRCPYCTKNYSVIHGQRPWRHNYNDSKAARYYYGVSVILGFTHGCREMREVIAASDIIVQTEPPGIEDFVHEEVKQEEEPRQELAPEEAPLLGLIRQEEPAQPGPAKKACFQRRRRA